jgi:hypothetical protein
MTNCRQFRRGGVRPAARSWANGSVITPWGRPEPDSWIDELGVRWLLATAEQIGLLEGRYQQPLLALEAQGLIERRRFTIEGQVREGVRIREAALELKLAMLEE